MLKEAQIELTIDPQQSQEQLLSELESVHAEQRKLMWETAALDNVDDLFKPDPRRVDRKSTVLAAIRPVSGHGTPFFFSVSGFFVGAGANLAFFGSWVLSAYGTVLPASGDQDLFLHLFSRTGPVVSSSRLGGSARDLVWFSTGGLVPIPIVPVFRVNGWVAGTCSNFSAWGA